MTKIFVYIDESGTLPDPKDRWVVLAAVAVADPVILARPVKPGDKEFKFYSAGERGRKLYLEQLAKKEVAIFTLAAEKGTQKIPDTPQNYAVLSWLLLLDCLVYFQDHEIEIIFDRHFHRSVDEGKLFISLQELLGLKVKIRSVDSGKEAGIIAADMVAGAFLYAQGGKSEKFFGLIKNKVISEKLINWKEAKRKFLEASKNSPEPV